MEKPSEKTVVASTKGTYILKGSTGTIFIPADLVKDSTFPLKVDQKVQVTINKDTIIIQKLPRMQHLNTYEDHVTIYDNQVETGQRIGAEIDVYLNEKNLICNYCHKTNCIHTEYALTLQKVQEAYKNKNLKLPE